METSLRCQHAASCGKPATYLCPVCGGPYCGEHFLRASFLDPELPAPMTYASCPACLAQVIQQQQRQGQRLDHWQKVG